MFFKKISCCFKKKWGAYFFVFLFSFFYFVALQGFVGATGDPDGFYHTKISQLIYKQGIIKDFPYLQKTTLKNNFADHHLLYHLILAPFVSWFSPLWSAKYVTMIITSLYFVLFFAFLKKLKIKFPFFYICILLVSPSFIFRLNLIKASSLALIFFISAIWLLFQKKYLLLFFLSFGYVYAHGSFPLLFVLWIAFWLSNVIVILFKKEHYKKIFKKEYFVSLSAVIGGVGAGLVINPYFPQNIYFYYEQIFKIAFINLGKIIEVGAEWSPYSVFDLFFVAFAVISLLGVACLFFGLKYKKYKQKEYFLFILTLLFFILTIGKAKRYIEYFIPIAVLFSAMVLNNEIKNVSFLKNYKLFTQNFFAVLNKYKIIGLYFFIIILLIVFNSSFAVFNALNKGRFDKYKNSVTWLRENSGKGDIVFNSDWDEFPELFFYNSKNYYLVGLDATFMYDYNQKKYWLWHDIVEGYITKNLANLIKNNFSAKWIFIRKQDHSDFADRLSISQGVTLRYEDNNAYIYQIADKY